MEYHSLTPDQVTALAGDGGDVSAIEELNASRVSLHLLLLKHLVGSEIADPELEPALSTLAEVQAAEPNVYAHLFGDPMVGAWLSRTAREVPHRSEILQLGSLAAAGAIRADLDCRVIGWADRGRLVIPTVGTAVLDDESDGPVDIRVSPGVVTVVGTSGGTLLRENENWWPLRRLRAEHGSLTCSVRLEDASPYRDGYHAPPSEQLTDDEARTWQSLFGQAWALIGQHLPERAAEIAVGLRAVVPLVDRGDGSSRSGTAHDSVGAMGATMPRSAVDFAVTIVHEFEHSKLSAMIDLMPLYHPGGTELHYAPWRSDRRPTPALLQGVSAFLRVADSWRRFAAVPEIAETACAEFAAVREQVRVGYESLAASQELTAAGVRFVAVLGMTLERMLAESLPPEIPTRTESLLKRPRQE